MDEPYEDVADTADEQLYEQIYYTACRIRAGDSAGSGIVFYSEYDDDGVAHTYVLTNHHVIEGLISVEEKWDPTLKKEYPQEETSTAQVEFFSYNDYSKAVGAETYQADIVAWDDKDRRDIGVLKLREQEDTWGNVAKMYPREVSTNIYMGDDVYAVGAALGNPVIQTPGEITNARVEMNGQKFVQTNSPITFGNSGGGLFKKGADGDYYLIGLPARVSMQGFGSVANHLGFAVPIDTVYDFLEENYFHFLWDDSVSIDECDQRRQEQREEAKQRLIGEQ